MCVRTCVQQNMNKMKQNKFERMRGVSAGLERVKKRQNPRVTCPMVRETMYGRGRGVSKIHQRTNFRSNQQVNKDCCENFANAKHRGVDESAGSEGEVRASQKHNRQ